MSIWVFWFGFFFYYAEVTQHFFFLILGRRTNFQTVYQHSCPRHTGKVCPNCRLVRRKFTNPPELLEYLLQNEWEKFSPRVCWPHSTGQEPDTLLKLQDLNSLWLISRGKVSNMFRHSCLLLLQDLTAPCSSFGPFLQSSKCPTWPLSVHQDLSVLRSRGVSLTCSCICSMTQSQKNNVQLKKN